VGRCYRCYRDCSDLHRGRVLIGRVVTGIIAVIAFAAIAYGAWRLQRWFNWEFGYGDMVEARIHILEKRVEALEHKNK